MIDGLIVWAIYDHPTDYPKHFVARKFMGTRPTRDLFGREKLDDLRQLMIQRGLARMERHPDDDSKIIEVWI